MLLTAFVVWRASPRGRSLALAFGLVEATLLVVTPSSHMYYFVFLLPAWTAVFAELIRTRSRGRPVGSGFPSPSATC